MDDQPSERPRLTRVSALTRSLAWLPALFVLIIPAWLLIRASSGKGGSDALGAVFGERLFQLLGNSLGLALTVATGSVLLSLPLAWLTTRTNLPGRRLFMVLLALPLTLPSYVGAFALVSAFGLGGPLSGLLSSHGDLYGFWGASAALTLLGFPYVLLPLQAALSQLDPRLEESARSLGQSPLRAFFSVSLPLIRPALIGGALMTVLYVLSDFGAVAMLQFNTFTRVIYTQHDAMNREGAAALALILVALTGLILALELRFRNTRIRRASRHGRGSFAAPLISLGRWRWLGLAFVLLVVFVSLGAPLLVIGFWAFKRGNICDFCHPLPELAGHSLLIALFTALVAMVLVLPVGRLAVRVRTLAGQLPDRILYAGFALPGVVIALALVFVSTRYLPGLYQTLPMLVLACVIRFLPQASDSLRPAMERVPESLEESARTLGLTPTQAFWRVTVPLVWPSLLAGGTLVFLTTLKELPAVLVMRPTGWDTLSTELWDLTNEGFYGEAAWRAIWLIALGVVPMVFIVWRRHRASQRDQG